MSQLDRPQPSSREDRVAVRAALGGDACGFALNALFPADPCLPADMKRLLARLSGPVPRLG